MSVEKMLLLLLECPGGEGESTLSHNRQLLKCAPVAVSRDWNSVVFAFTGQPSWGGSTDSREKDVHLGLTHTGRQVSGREHGLSAWSFVEGQISGGWGRRGVGIDCIQEIFQSSVCGYWEERKTMIKI